MPAFPKHVAVVGAGPAGLTAAYELSKRGVRVDVFEADAQVGGMAKTISLWGQPVDLGPHRFFSSDPRVNRLWLEVIESDYEMISRLTRIYYKRTFFYYPLRPVNALRGLGLAEALRCIQAYCRIKIRPSADIATFEDWVVSRFGRRLFEIFFKSYSEKLWGIGCDELDSEFATQRIRKFSLSEAIKSAFGWTGDSRHKTLADEFAYPHGGAGVVYERMAERVRDLGGTIHLQRRVKAIHPAQDRGDAVVVELEDGEMKRYDHAVSTMPINRLVEQLDAPEEVKQHAGCLRFRNTILVYLRVLASDLFPDQWIYVHSEEMRAGRITNFRNWSTRAASESPDTILCLEYWCYDEDPIWTEDDASLVAMARRELAMTGLSPDRLVSEGHVVRVPKCYPVYSRGYKENLKPVEAFLTGLNGITAIGRYGSFKYNNQDHSILMGLLAADNIAGGSRHDLWAVNTDYEYQEASRITATGLQMA